jgi:excisionase family DNA binding protein
VYKEGNELMVNNKKIVIANIVLVAVIIGISMWNLSATVSASLNNISQSISDVSYKIDDDPNQLIVYKSLGEAAHYLNIPKDDLQKIIDDKSSNIPYIKVGNKINFYRHALNEWIKSSTINID